MDALEKRTRTVPLPFWNLMNHRTRQMVWRGSSYPWIVTFDGDEKAQEETWTLDK